MKWDPAGSLSSMVRRDGKACHTGRVGGDAGGLVKYTPARFGNGYARHPIREGIECSDGSLLRKGFDVR
jgi:hypothetical protein